MKIIAFILDTTEIKKITSSLGIPQYRALPAIAPNTSTDSQYEPFVEAA